jgi:hypothetical protein
MAWLQAVTLSALLLSGCDDVKEVAFGPPEKAEDCKVSAAAFESAKQKIAKSKPYSELQLGACVIGNDDAGRIIITTRPEIDENRRSLENSKAS